MKNKICKETNLYNFLKNNESRIMCPHIQRDFVWKKEQIEQLFDSIYKGFFIGMFWFWETPKQEIDNIEFFELPKNFTGTYEQAQVKGRPIAVVDGQQRLTSLKIGIYGTFGEKHKEKLYLNISRKHKSLFKFFKKGEITTGNKEWFPVSKIFDKTRNIPIKAKEFKKIFTKTKIVVYWIQKKTLIEVTEIFRRVNKGGTQLTNSQELMSRLSSIWQESRTEFEEIRKKVQEKSITINNDFIIKSCLFCIGEPIKIKIQWDDNDNKIVEKIKENWDGIKNAIINMSKEINKFGFDDSNIISYNSLIPLIYIWYKDWNQYKKEDIISKYLYRAILLRKFGKGTDNVLENARKSLNSNSGLFELIKEYRAKDGEINKILELEKSRYTKLALKLLYGYGSTSKHWHDDHMHPQKAFLNDEKFCKRIKTELKGKYNKSKTLKKWEQWKLLYNKLPNLQALLDSVNKNKQGTPLEKWALENKKYFNKTQNFLDEDTSLKLCKFKDFYNIRMKKMKNRLIKELQKKN